MLYQKINPSRSLPGPITMTEGYLKVTLTILSMIWPTDAPAFWLAALSFSLVIASTLTARVTRFWSPSVFAPAPGLFPPDGMINPLLRCSRRQRTNMRNMPGCRMWRC